MSADGRATRRAELGLPLSNGLGIAAEGHAVSSSSSSSASHPGGQGLVVSPKRNNHNNNNSSSSKYSSTGRVIIKPAGSEVNVPPSVMAKGPSTLSMSATDDNGDDYGDTLPSQQHHAVRHIEENQRTDRDGEGDAVSDHLSPTHAPSPTLKPRPTQSPMGSAGVGFGVESVSAVRQSLTLLKTKTRRSAATTASPAITFSDTYSITNHVHTSYQYTLNTPFPLPSPSLNVQEICERCLVPLLLFFLDALLPHIYGHHREPTSSPSPPTTASSAITATTASSSSVS